MCYLIILAWYGVLSHRPGYTAPHGSRVRLRYCIIVLPLTRDTFDTTTSIITSGVRLPLRCSIAANSRYLLPSLRLLPQIFDRPRSYVNLSSFLLWGLGVATVVWASVRSADDIRRRTTKPVEGSSAARYASANYEEPPVSRWRQGGCGAGRVWGGEGRIRYMVG